MLRTGASPSNPFNNPLNIVPMLELIIVIAVTTAVSVTVGEIWYRKQVKKIECTNTYTSTI